MARRDISIHRDLPVINGFVQVPNNAETDKTRVTTAEALAAISGSATTRLSMGSGTQTGWKAGQQEWVRLPGLTPGESYTTELGADPVDTLANS